ncbi:MAG TPA: hypothetical protein VGB53_12775 [Rubricoccaceae bacterium]|jgi:hypothetical protein
MRSQGRLVFLLGALAAFGPGAACQTVGPLGLGADLGTAVRSDRDRTAQGATPLIVAGLIASVRTPPLSGTGVGFYVAARGEVGAGRSPGDRYRFVSVPDGSGDDRARCVEATTGEPAARGRCVGTYGGVSAEGGVAVPVRGAIVGLGAGYRAGMGPGPIAAVTVSGARLLYLRGEAGLRGGALVFGLGSF